MVLQRVKRDFYPSPTKLIQAWLAIPENRKHFGDNDTMLECCDGDGAISDVLRTYGYDVEATDIIDSPDYDATTGEYWRYRQPDWVFTNPPFNQATFIMDHALENCKKGVVMILRSTYLEPCKDRRHILDNRISHISYVNPRPRFRSDTGNTDLATVVFITWLKHKTSPTQIVSFLTDWQK